MAKTRKSGRSRINLKKLTKNKRLNGGVNSNSSRSSSYERERAIKRIQNIARVRSERKKLATNRIQNFARARTRKKKQAIYQSLSSRLPDELITEITNMTISNLHEPTIKNAKELIRKYQIDGWTSEIILKYFKYYSRDKNAFLQQNQIINDRLKKILKIKLSRRLYNILFENNSTYSLDNKPWYITVGLLQNIVDRLNEVDIYSEYALPISDINDALHSINPNLYFLSIYDYENPTEDEKNEFLDFREYFNVFIDTITYKIEIYLQKIVLKTL